MPDYSDYTIPSDEGANSRIRPSVVWGGLIALLVALAGYFLYSIVHVSGEVRTFTVKRILSEDYGKKLDPANVKVVDSSETLGTIFNNASRKDFGCDAEAPDNVGAKIIYEIYQTPDDKAPATTLIKLPPGRTGQCSDRRDELAAFERTTFATATQAFVARRDMPLTLGVIVDTTDGGAAIAPAVKQALIDANIPEFVDAGQTVTVLADQLTDKTYPGSAFDKPKINDKSTLDALEKWVAEGAAKDNSSVYGGMSTRIASDREHGATVIHVWSDWIENSGISLYKDPALLTDAKKNETLKKYFDTAFTANVKDMIIVFHPVDSPKWTLMTQAQDFAARELTARGAKVIRKEK